MNRVPSLPNTDTQWQRKAALIVNQLRGAVDRAGATAERPEDAYVGFAYFDRTLNKPIWMGNSGWVKADGTAA
jgi:hypothetical protein